ncbi:traf3ip1 protein, putative [Ichthyophthirius multifiliis]|uniref:Traf3ip1 protein, putative n=1 Tax=Ichthyophthirius multifiliis TaxID=5932 RepID=G0R5L6_ICHMU|nr:traf3ip1 protein, putative [Ichthyophthirius multifiliis]EGR27224.1 traf3ip1 protein, putative [Ichthyophthirius multifiliis]|eukprot:XP_004024108.1 traf3ip1 protein, putative [Ichthyophthirius multifiliis]
MAEENFWEPTIKAFEGLFQKPKMRDKLLQKPPFQYLFDIVMATTDATGFGEGLYTDEEKNSQFYQNRDQKITFLKKIIDLTQYAIKQELPAKPNKIVAGLEPENTNIFLIELHRSATTPEINKNGPKIIKKLLAKYSQKEGSAQEKTQEKPAENNRKNRLKKYRKSLNKKEKKQEEKKQEEKKQPLQKKSTVEIEAPPIQQQQKKEAPQIQQQQTKVAQQRPTSSMRAPPKVQDNSKVVENTHKGNTNKNINLSGKGHSKFTQEALNDGLNQTGKNQNMNQNANQQEGEDVQGNQIKMQLRKGKKKMKILLLIIIMLIIVIIILLIIIVVVIIKMTFKLYYKWFRKFQKTQILWVNHLNLFQMIQKV